MEKSDKVSKLFKDKGLVDDEVVFRFEPAKGDDGLNTWMSLADYSGYSKLMKGSSYFQSKQLKIESNELYASKAFLCVASDVFKTMFDSDSQFSEEVKGVVTVRDFPRRSYLAFFRMIHPHILQIPSSKFTDNRLNSFVMCLTMTNSRSGEKPL